MIPGAPHPILIAGGGDPLDELGVIARSIRFRRSATASMARTPAVAGNRKTLTYGLSAKRGELSVLSGVMGAGVSGVGLAGMQIAFNADNTLRVLDASSWNNTAIYTFDSVRVFRDPSAHLDIHVAIDTTQATDTERFKVWVNGELLAFAAATKQLPALNAVGTINNNVSHILGAGENNTGRIYGENTISRFYIVDGKALPPTVAGQFHPITGQWRPKSNTAFRAAVAVGGGARNGWGINGGLWLFDDNTSLTTLGYDRSQSDTDTTGNNLTAANISLTAGDTYDSMLDTSTYNCPTFNSLAMPPVDVTTPTLADGNLVALTSDGILGHFKATALIPSTGSWQWEYLCRSGNGRDAHGVTIASASPSSRGWDQTGAVAYCADGTKYVSGVNSAYGAPYTVGDAISFVVDRTAQTITFFKNGASQGAVPLPIPSADLVPMMSDFGGSGGGGGSGRTGVSGNFGQKPFSYPVAGAKSLSAKNLPRPSIPDTTTAFVAATDSGANIVATLAAAASKIGSNWIKIYKRRDAAEGWRWQFFDDSAYYLDSSSAAAKAAFPALVGTSYVGYALRVSSANGVATGRLTHVNGVSDTVTDGLGNSRKAIILKNEATGTWYMCHPDCALGTLLYLEQQGAESADPTISTVLSNSFVVASALPSGTYRWIAFAEVDGVLKLTKHDANVSNDGPFDTLGFSPAFSLLKKRLGVSAASSVVVDAQRNPSNLTNLLLFPNTTGAEVTGTGTVLDQVSNGSKMRGAGLEINYGSGYSYVGLHVAAFPFRYANAR